jgi:alkylation response protein AidB-like acyl-CoA dehydrogenase
MDFSLSEEQQLFRDSVRGFAERHLRAGALERALAETYPGDIARLMAQQGLLGITMTEEDGGQGGTLMDAVLAIEAVALVCPRSADVLQAGNFGPVRVLAEYGSADQKKRYLSRLLRGEMLIAVAMTEPEAGSAVTDLQTTAVADSDGFRVNGSKVFTSLSKYADVFLVYVRFGPGVDGIGSMLIERDSEGFSIGQPMRFLSGEQWAQLYFDNVYVAPENVLLGKGGFKKQIAGFNVERIGNSARALALGQHAFDLAREYAMTRRQFSRPLCEFQGLQWKFADMLMQLDAARLLLYRAAANADKGLPSAQETAIAKAYCNRAGFEVASEALQIMGGTGYSEGTLVEYCFRRTRGWMIAGGSIEMMKNRIAEGIFERRFSQRPPSPSADD